VGVFGDKLRKQRELRGISLDAISTTTKISPRMLRAIEDEHFDQLPGGVFNKGFVRAYARQVGLDAEEAVSDYLTALRESQIQAQTILPSFRAPGAKSPRNEPDPRNPDRNDNVSINVNHNHNVRGNGDHPGQGNPLPHSNSITDLPAESAGVDRRLEVRRREARRGEDREAHPNEAAIREARASEAHPDETLAHAPSPAPLSFLQLDYSHPSPQAATQESLDPNTAAPPAANDPSRHVPWGKLAAALLLITLTLALWTLYRRNRPAAASLATASSLPNAVPPVPVAALASAEPALAKSPSATHSSAPTASANHPAVNPDPDVNPPVSKPNTHVTVAKPPASFTLLIRADQTSWVSITADGQPMARETLIAPAHTSVRAIHEIIVRAGNAAGISFLLNGKEIPVGGNPGEVRSYTFDATGLQSSSSVPPASTTR
jgi:hypothetical protein